MLSDYSTEMQVVLCVLAVWRLTHFLVLEDGPWDMVVRLRARLGESMAGRVMDCFYCTSIWMAVPFAWLVAHGVISGLVCWLALSGGASLLEQFTSSHQEPKP